MKLTNRRTRGFTLIELIFTLVLLGIITAIASLGVSSVVEGYLFASDNAKTASDVQIAMARIEKEVNVITSVSSGSSSSITYNGLRTGGTSETHTLSWSGTSGAPLLLDGNSLLNNVSSFSMAYYDDYSGTANSTWTAARSIIQFSITVNGAQGIDSNFTMRITPRNN